MRIGVLFKQFGSSWSATKAGLYPEPECDIIVDHYCGGAGYPLNFCDRSVYLYDIDPNIRALWSWLITHATGQDILDIPVGVPQGTDIRTLGLSYGQALMLKHWQRTNNVGDCWTISSWGHMPGQWTHNTRARVAEQVQAIKHWKLLGSPLSLDTRVTHFIDPPYFDNYQYRQPRIDYADLAQRCIASPGQIIVCEALGTNGTRPNWLPFREAGSRVTSRRKASQSHHRMEFMWTKPLTTELEIGKTTYVI